MPKLYDVACEVCHKGMVSTEENWLDMSLLVICEDCEKAFVTPMDTKPRRWSMYEIFMPGTEQMIQYSNLNALRNFGSQYGDEA